LIDAIEPIRITDDPLERGSAFCTINNTPRTLMLKSPAIGVGSIVYSERGRRHQKARICNEGTRPPGDGQYFGKHNGVTEMRDAKHKPPAAAPKTHIDEPKNPATAIPRQANGKFAKGFSGNPAGPKPGTRSRAARLAEQLLEIDVPEVCRAVIDAAKAGDMTAARIIIERLVPPRKDRPVTFPLPKLESAIALRTFAAKRGKLLNSPICTVCECTLFLGDGSKAPQ